MKQRAVLRPSLVFEACLFPKLYLQDDYYLVASNLAGSNSFFNSNRGLSIASAAAATRE